MVSNAREEAVRRGARSVGADVGVNELVEELPNIGIDGGRFTVGIIVVAGGDDEIGIPAFNQVGHGLFVRCRDRPCVSRAVVANNADGDLSCRQRRGRPKERARRQ